MKIFSTKKPVSIVGDQIEINDLALNHKYKSEGLYLTVDGKDSSTPERTYKAYYNKKGKFCYVRVRKQERSKALLPWKVEYLNVTLEKIDSKGNYFITTSVYLTTDKVKKKLVRKTFKLGFEGAESAVEFELSDKWCSKGHLDRRHRAYWLKEKNRSL